MTLPVFQIGVTYNLVPMGTSVLGAAMNYVVFAGEMSYQLARLIDPALATTHARMVAQVPGLLTDASVHTYLVFHNKDDPSQKQVLAKEWISTASAVNENTATITVVLSSASVDNKAALSTLLNSLPSVITSHSITYSGT